MILLVIENNIDDRDLLTRVFEKDGINPVVFAEDGQAALDYLVGEHSDTRELPQLVLLDLTLPKVPGLTVLRRIREDARTRLLRVVILTGSRSERDIVNAYELGAAGYVAKPISHDEFIHTVRSIVHYWLRLNIPAPKGKP